MGICCDKPQVLFNEPSNQTSMVSRKTSGMIDQYSRLSDYKKRYEFLSNIGNGGFGKVRLFRDKKSMEMKYAIKTIKKTFIDNHSMKSIMREVEILRKVDHPNIVKYLETYEDDMYIHIVMEYIEGDNLLKMITSKPYMGFGEKDVHEIMLVLCKTVFFLHNNNIIHRDLKPQNILFGKSGDYATLKLIDFGLSIRHLEKDSYRVGSPLYMAPEMIKGAFSFSSDVWSIGVIMYFMVTGKQPFLAKEREAVFALIKKGKYDKALLGKSKCSPQLKELIERILVLDGNQRITLRELLDHPWVSHFQSDKADVKLDKEIIDSLREFNEKNLLQKETLFVMAKISNENEILKLKKAFEIIDKDHSGEIEYSEIPKIFERVGIKANTEEIDRIWNGMDFHKDGKINYTEFLAATLSLVSFSQEERLWSVFRYFDPNDTGFITANSIIEALKSNNCQVNEKDMTEVFKSFKAGENSKMNFIEFKSAFFAPQTIKAKVKE